VKWIHEFHVASHSKLGASHCRNDIRYSYLLTHIASDGHSSRAQHSVPEGRGIAVPAMNEGEYTWKSVLRQDGAAFRTRP